MFLVQSRGKQIPAVPNVMKFAMQSERRWRKRTQNFTKAVTPAVEKVKKSIELTVQKSQKGEREKG